MDEKEQVQNEIAYFITFSFLRDLYETGKFSIERIEKLNKMNAKMYGCVPVDIL